MASDLGIDVGTINPVAYAHLQLRGGWKNMAITGGAYAAAIGLLMFATLRLNPKSTMTTLSAWHTGLLVLQTAFLTFLSCAAINAAIRVDTTSHMLESHRLMPISPLSAVLGYLIGAPCQFMVMAAVTFVYGAAATVGAGIPPMRWVVANAVLGGFALMLWSGIVFFAMSVKHGVRWYFGFLIAALFTQGIVLFLLPGLALLTSPLMNHTIFEARSWTARMNAEYVLAMVAQALVIGIFLTGAARRFRRPDRPAMGTLLSLILLASWIAISYVGIAHWKDIRPMMAPREEPTVQFVATLAASLLLALVPMAAASRAEADWRRHRQLDDPAPMRRPLPPLLMPLLCASMILAVTRLPFGKQEMPLAEARVRTWLCIWLFLMAAGYLHRMMHRAQGRAVLITFIFVVLVWVGPFLADMVRYALSADDENLSLLSKLFTASPLGMMIAIWSPERRHPINTNGGLIFQAALMLVMAGLFYRPVLFNKVAAPPAPLPPPG